MQNVTKEYVAVMVAVHVTMDGTSNRIVQVILVPIETYLLHIIMKKSPSKELCSIILFSWFLGLRGNQKYTYRVLQTIQKKLIILCVWAEWAVLGSAKSALKFKYEIWIG